MNGTTIYGEPLRGHLNAIYHSDQKIAIRIGAYHGVIGTRIIKRRIVIAVTFEEFADKIFVKDHVGLWDDRWRIFSPDRMDLNVVPGDIYFFTLAEAIENLIQTEEKNEYYHQNV